MKNSYCLHEMSSFKQEGLCQDGRTPPKRCSGEQREGEISVETGLRAVVGGGGGGETLCNLTERKNQVKEGMQSSGGTGLLAPVLNEIRCIDWEGHEGMQQLPVQTWEPQ